MKVDWLPDWRNESEYPDIHNMEPSLVAWQFLRRNPQYQQDYYDLYGKLTDEEREKFKARMIDADNPENDDLWVYEPSRLENESLDKWIERAAEVGGKRTLKPQHVSGTYGLSLVSLPDPSQDLSESSLFWFESSGGPRFLGPYNRETIDKWLENPEVLGEMQIKHPNEVAVMFDLSRPIGFQTARVELLLKQFRKSYKESGEQIHNNKNRFDKYKNYLRILDAKTDDVTNSEIADCLYPHITNGPGSDYAGDRAVREDYKAAQRLRDTDYRWIPIPKKSA